MQMLTTGWDYESNGYTTGEIYPQKENINAKHRDGNPHDPLAKMINFRREMSAVISASKTSRSLQPLP
jgi:hypothetical protein